MNCTIHAVPAAPHAIITMRHAGINSVGVADSHAYASSGA
jgi:hypothetical protein